VLFINFLLFYIDQKVLAYKVKTQCIASLQFYVSLPKQSPYWKKTVEYFS